MTKTAEEAIRRYEKLSGKNPSASLPDGEVGVLMDYVLYHKIVFPSEPLRITLSQWIKVFRTIVPDYPESAANIEEKELWGVEVKVVS